MERHHQNLHISHHWHLSEKLKSRYTDLVLADTFRLLALSMVSIFVPIFLLEKNYSILQVCLFEIIIFIGSLGFHFFVIKNLSFFGVKRSMIISYFFNIVFYLALFYFDYLFSRFGGNLFLLLIAFLDFVSLSFYWTSHHVYFLSVTDAKQEGKKLGILLAVPNVVGIIAPFLGSVIIVEFGFKGVFLLSSVLLVLASYTLFLSKNIEIHIDRRLNNVFDFGNFKKNLIYVIQGAVYVATGFVWPLFLFYSSIKMIQMGLFYLVSNIVYSVLTYFGGTKNDQKGGAQKISQIGSFGQGLSLIFRSLSTSIYTLSIFQVMGGFFGGLLHVSLDTCFYKRSHSDVSSAIMNRELYMYIGRLMMIFVFIAALMSFSVIKSLILVLMIAGALLFSLNFLINNSFFKN